MESLIIKKQIAQQKMIERIQIRQANTINYTNYNFASAISLSRGAVVFAANVAQVMVWETEIRNTTNENYQIPITWSGSIVNIPQSGYYTITWITSYSVSTAQMGVALAINGVLGVTNIADNSIQQLHSVSFTQYFNENDYFELSVTFTTAGTLQTNQERNVNESPLLYVARTA